MALITSKHGYSRLSGFEDGYQPINDGIAL